MEIKHGSCRTAFVGERVTVKVPKVHVRNAATLLREALETRNLAFIKSVVLGRDDELFTLSENLLKGWLENLREARGSAELKGVVVPTRFSVLGVINVMDTAEDIHIGELELSRAFKEEGLKSAIAENSDFDHTTASPSNFGKIEGVVYLRDYGERGVGQLLQKNHKAFRRALDRLSSSHQS
jgi:hypothetical protein